MVNDTMFETLGIEWRWPSAERLGTVASNLVPEARDILYALLASSALTHASRCTMQLRREYERSAVLDVERRVQTLLQRWVLYSDYEAKVRVMQNSIE